MQIQVIVATHKAYRMPDDPMYLPIHVGRANAPRDLGYAGDDTGDNISEKNPGYCELTGLYWAWKNLDSDYIGLAHYRRHFRGKSGRDKWSSILSSEEASALLSSADVLLPKPRRYFIETCYNQFIHAPHSQGLDLALSLAAGTGPAYASAVQNFRKRTSAHIFNMLIMRRDLLDGYCSWLFPILFQVETQVDTSRWSQYDQRAFGFIGERLLDIWLEANGISCREVPVMFMEKENWLKKGSAFLWRKFRKGGI